MRNISNGSTLIYPFLQCQRQKSLAVTPDGIAKRMTNSTENQEGGLDKQILLKKGMIRQYIHQYDLRLTIKSRKDEDDELTAILMVLQAFFETMLQADPKSVIPVHFELVHSEKNIQGLSIFFYSVHP